MKQFLRVGLLFCWLLAAGATMRGGNLIIDTREDWNMIISQLHDETNSREIFLREMRELITTKSADFESNCDQAEKRLSELKYLFKAQSSQNAFAVTLYSKQIYDLQSSLGDKVKGMAHIITKVDRDILRVDDAQKLLEKVNQKYLLPENRQKLSTVIAGFDVYRKQLHEIRAILLPLQARASKIQENLTVLYDSSEKHRKEVFESLVFNRQYSVLLMLSSSILIRGWLMGVPQWLAIQVPVSIDFWFNFLLLLLFAALPLIIAGRYLFYYLVSHLDFPEKYAKRPVFMLGWSMLVLSGCCVFTRFMIGEVEAMVFFRIGQFLLGCGCLLLALTIRLDRKALRQALWIYVPVMLQFVSGLLLSITVAPYQPLMVFIFLFNLPIIVLEIWVLKRTNCSYLDHWLGIITVFLALTVTVMAGLGLAYIAFSIAVMWFILIAGLQTGVAATAIIRGYCEQNSQRRVFNCLLMTLLTPATWLMIIGSLIYWMATMYNAEGVLQRMLFAQVVLWKYITVNLMDLLVCLIAALVLHFLISTVKHTVSIIFEDRAHMGLIPSFVTLGTYVAWGIYVILVLLLFHVDPSAILVVLGGMSMGIGFGMKEIVENFFSGIILLVGKQLRPGDTIELNGTWGKVRKVSIRATVVDTFDNSVITYPNSDILSKNFRNWTVNNMMFQADIKVLVKSASADIPKIKELLLKIAADSHEIMKTPAPQALLLEFTKDGMVFALECTMHVDNNGLTQSHIREEIGRIFKENDIIIA